MKTLKSHRTFEGRTKFLEHDSAATGTKMRFGVFEPKGEPRGALLWLSGLTCTEENFLTKAGAQRGAAAERLLLVCPDTSPRGLDLPGERDSFDFGVGAGFYVDATEPGYREHYRMRTYVADELYDWVTREYSLEGRVGIFGHSMGGHGALTLGLRQPEKFRALSAFAPISHPSAGPWGRKALAGYLGADPAAWRAYDACELLRAGARHPRPIRVDQGAADEYLETQLQPEALRAACAAAGQALDLRYREGYDHSYYFIATFIDEHLGFHAAALPS